MIKKNLLALAFAVISLASTRADFVTLTGTTTGASVFNRPTETGARSFFTVPYTVYQFNVTTSGPFSFTLTAADPANYDTFLHLFVNAFNPMDISDPAQNFLAANDDLNFANPALGSALTNVSLTAGTTYYLVLDGFSASDAGAFTATISGAGTINVIPEPSSIALLIVAGGALAVAALRRSRTARS